MTEYKSLTEYLTNKGLVINPIDIDTGLDPVLESDELLKEVAGLGETHGGSITQVIQARVNALMKELVEKAMPYEVPELRRGIVEVSAILDDLKRYTAENKRREQARQGEQSASEGVVETPPEPPKEGEEGTL